MAFVHCARICIRQRIGFTDNGMGLIINVFIHSRAAAFDRPGTLEARAKRKLSAVLPRKLPVAAWHGIVADANRRVGSDGDAGIDHRLSH